MTNFFKSTKGKVFTVVLVIVLIVGAIGAYFIFRNETKLEFDFATDMLVKNRVKNAQYLPNLDLLSNKSQSTELLATSPDAAYYSTDLSFDLKDYQSIVDELAIITGTATSRDTSILDIKEEIYTALDLVPAFDRWFRLPYDYHSTFYNLHYDKENERISITRMNWSVTCGIYSSEEDKIYSTYFDDDVEQHQIMQANYYFNEDNKEVVECSVVDFARFGKDFYPIQCQYLANIQDTSTTKIQSVIRKEIDAYSYKLKDNGNGNVDGGLDIDTYREGGVMKKVVQLNYTDSNNVELIKIEQNQSTDYLSDINTTNLAYYLRQNDNAIYFVDAWDYYDEENSVNDISLNNLFYIRVDDNLSKDRIINSFKNSSYSTRQVMSTVERGLSSRNVCSSCYNLKYNSNLLVYKCDHNKNQEQVARAERGTACSSLDYQDQIYELIPLNISKLISNFAKNIGISDEIISTYSGNIVQKLDDEYLFESNLDIFLAKASNDFIENVSLCKDVKDLYYNIKKKSKGLENKDLNKSAISSYITLDEFSESASVVNNQVTVNVTATVKSSILLEKNAKYSLGLVLYDDANNINYALLTNYKVYDGNDMSLELSGSYDLSEFILKDKDVKADRQLNLTLGYVLLKEGQRIDSVCSNYKTASISSGTFSAFTNNVNGFECDYQPIIENNKLTVSISFIDFTKPEIKIEKLFDNTLTFNSGATLFDLMTLINVTDNDFVATIKIFHGEEEYRRIDELLVEGINQILAVDRTGNFAVATFIIVLN